MTANLTQTVANLLVGPGRHLYRGWVPVESSFVDPAQGEGGVVHPGRRFIAGAIWPGCAKGVSKSRQGRAGVSV